MTKKRKRKQTLRLRGVQGGGGVNIERWTKNKYEGRGVDASEERTCIRERKGGKKKRR